MPSLILNTHDNPITSSAVLIHWYSFDGNLNDLAGSANLIKRGNGSDSGYATAAINGLGSSIYNSNNTASVNSGLYANTVIFTPGDFSIACWVYKIDDNGVYTFYADLVPATSGMVLRLYSDSNEIKLTTLAGSNLTQYVITNTIPYGVWTHVALTFNKSGKELKYYKNGIYIDKHNESTDYWNESSLNTSILGIATSGDYLAGMDDARYYTGILTDDEVFRIYRYLA